MVRQKKSMKILTFDKTYETIERVDNFGGFLLVKRLYPNNDLDSFSDKQIISDIIESDFHKWRGEEKPDGQSIQMSALDKDKNSKSWSLVNQQFYGFYDNSKIKPEHYNVISQDEFNDRLFQVIVEQTENDTIFIDKAKTLIKNNITDSTTVYYLNLDKEIHSDLVAEWQVYDFFYAFIFIDRHKNNVSLIEFGLD
jgi:hypothetical protein